MTCCPDQEILEWRDWCPLCGGRFTANTAEELCEIIIKHMEDGTCEKNFVPLEQALADDHY